MKTVEQKKINYLVEYLAVDKSSKLSILYKAVRDGLSKDKLHSISSFSNKQIASLAKKYTNLEIKDSSNANISLTKIRESLLPKELQKYKNEVLETLLKANFPQHSSLIDNSLVDFEAKLTPVEVKMYSLIGGYIASITEALDVYVLLDSEKTSNFQLIKEYVLKIHNEALELLFYKEERDIIAPSLEKTAIVYAGAYFHVCYLRENNTAKS